MNGAGLKLNFSATWGDLYYLGLTGLEIVGSDGEAIKVDMSMLHADPRDLHVLPGYEKDTRTLEKCVDGYCCAMKYFQLYDTSFFVDLFITVIVLQADRWYERDQRR